MTVIIEFNQEYYHLENTEEVLKFIRDHVSYELAEHLINSFLTPEVKGDEDSYIAEIETLESVIQEQVDNLMSLSKKLRDSKRLNRAELQTEITRITTQLINIAPRSE